VGEKSSSPGEQTISSNLLSMQLNYLFVVDLLRFRLHVFWFRKYSNIKLLHSGPRENGEGFRRFASLNQPGLAVVANR
jgi:hypothetical protein